MLKTVSLTKPASKSCLQDGQQGPDPGLRPVLLQEPAAQQQQAVDTKAIYDSVGGEEAYTEMIGWASKNLSSEEIASTTRSPTVATLRLSSSLWKP